MMTIHPHRGVNAITFGMMRSEVARVMGKEPLRARRNQFDAADYDFFRTLGLFVYYDTNDRCMAVEFIQGARVSYDGYELFAHPAHEVRAWARARDQDLDDKDGFISTTLGLSMYEPLIDEPDLDDEERAEPAQSFLVFRPGYYEEERKRLKSLSA